MREDLPSPELQDLHPVPGDGHVPFGWLRSIDRACTEWLLKRDLLGSPAEHRVNATGAPNEEHEAAAPTAMSVAITAEEPVQ